MKYIKCNQKYKDLSKNNQYILLQYNMIYSFLKNENKTSKYIWFKFLIILFFIIINFYLIFIYASYNNYFLKDTNINPNLKEKFLKELYFIQSCLNDRKIKSFEKYDKPKITMVIPFYNAEKYLTRLLISIQNQELKELEIIFVEDCSTDKGLKLLEKYSKIDKRIRIIKNKENKGCFYSYAIGILEAKANHTMILDDDDMLLSNLKELYEISYKNNKDINDFGFIQGGLKNFDEIIRKDQILYQPKIGEMIFTHNYIGCTFIVNKIYKTEIVKNAIRTLKKEYFDSNIIIHCDTFLFIHIFYFVKSYQSYSNLFGYFHIFNEDTASGNISNKYNKLFQDTLYLVKYVSEMKYTSKYIYNRHIRFAIDILKWPIELCGERKLKVDWNNFNKVMNKILNNKNLNKKNINELYSLIKNIKRKNLNQLI